MMKTDSISMTLLEDLKEIVKAHDFTTYHGQTILITGATGLLGSLLVKSFLLANETLHLNIKVLALVRNKQKAKELFTSFTTACLEIIEVDLLKPIETEGDINFIIHTASPTASSFFINSPVDTIDISVNGTKNILDLAKQKKVKKLVYLSSMEMYGITDSTKSTITEEDLGYIDVLSTRSCYPESKRLCECLCNAYASEYDLPVVIIRLSQVFGPGVSLADNRLFAQMAKAIMNKQNIVLHTDGQAYSNSCYSVDAILAILHLLTGSNQHKVYNVANELNQMKIIEVAKLLAKGLAHDEIQVICDLPKSEMNLGYAPNSTLRLDTNRMKAIGWMPKYGLLEMYQRLINYYQEILQIK